MEHHDENCFKCYLTIYNCAAAQKISGIHALLSGFENKFKQKFNTFRIIHYVNQQDDLLSKLRMLKINLPLYSAFSDYHLISTDLTTHPWAGHIDFFTLKYGRQSASGASDWRYMVGNIECDRRAYAYTTDNRALYKFFTCGDEQNTGFEIDSDISPLELNMFKKNPASVLRRILISPGPCFDSIIPSIRDNLLERVKNGSDLKTIRNILDPVETFAMYSDAQVLEFGMNNLKSRFEVSEKNETINILTIDGLKTFATQNITSEILISGEPFTMAEVLLQLEYIKSRLGDPTSSGQQSFYIFNARLNQPMYRYVILKNMLIGAFSPNDVNPLLSATLLKDKTVADALYNYITYEMIDKTASIHC
jgi:hypothetical protein